MEPPATVPGAGVAPHRHRRLSDRTTEEGWNCGSPTSARTRLLPWLAFSFLRHCGLTYGEREPHNITDSGSDRARLWGDGRDAGGSALGLRQGREPPINNLWVWWDSWAVGSRRDETDRG